METRTLWELPLGQHSCLIKNGSTLYIHYKVQGQKFFSIKDGKTPELRLLKSDIVREVDS